MVKLLQNLGIAVALLLVGVVYLGWMALTINLYVH
jgi:hypothetical protein